MHPPTRAAVTVLALALAGCTTPAAGGSATTATPDADVALELPTAPEDDRVDTGRPVFSDPTRITNPLFPIADLDSGLLLGNGDANLLRVETTLLPDTRTIAWDGQEVETLASQYLAYEDGRLAEVAIDWYAQADDGSVWYFGEDVWNYDDGVVADTEGTWLAGREGPPGMIMPADPEVGDVYRPENAPGVVFEEVTVRDVAADGAVTVEELHMDGVREDKVFAPGYGEFRTGRAGDLEDLAVGVPTDALDGAPPASLTELTAGAGAVFDAAVADDWPAAAAGLDELETAWDAHRGGTKVPALLRAQMERALAALRGDALVPAVAGHNRSGAAKTALDVAQAALDLELRHRPPHEVDRDRFDLWSRQLLVDVGDAEAGAVAGDVAVLERLRDRFPRDEGIDAVLEDLRAAADEEDLATVAERAPDLVDQR